MKPRWEEFRDALRGASDLLDVSPLLALLDEDIALQQARGIAVAAPDAASFAVVRETVTAVSPSSRLDMFPPYRGLRDWDGGTPDRIFHADMLVACTNARQFLPAILFRLLEIAAAEALPVLLLVEGIERMRDPIALVNTLAQEIRRALPASSPQIAFLGGQRFEEKTVTEALAGFLITARAAGGDLQAVRSAHRFQQRRKRARTVAQGALDSWIAMRRNLQIGERRLQEDREVLLSTGSAIPAFWSSSVQELINEIWAYPERRGHALVAGEPSSEFKEIYSTWNAVFRAAFEKKVAAYFAIASGPSQPIRSSNMTLLAKPLSSIVNGACADLAQMHTEFDEKMKAARTGRDISGQRAQNLQNATRLAGVDVDAEAEISSENTGASDDGASVFADVGVVVGQFLNVFTKKKVINLMIQLTAQVNEVRESVAIALNQTVTHWVTTIACPSGSVDDSQTSMKEMDRRIAGIEKFLSHLENL